jgi:hypothetical protein
VIIRTVLLVVGLALVGAGLLIDRYAGICENNCAGGSATVWLGIPGVVLILVALAATYEKWSRREWRRGTGPRRSS